MEIDPKITVSAALEAFDGNQSALARALGLKRSTVNEWVHDETQVFVPPLHAYRLQRMKPDRFGDAQDQAA